MLDTREVNDFMAKAYALLREKTHSMQAFHIQYSLKLAYRSENADQINYCLAKVEQKLLSLFNGEQQKINDIRLLFSTAPRLPDFSDREEDIFRFEP